MTTVFFAAQLRAGRFPAFDHKVTKIPGMRFLSKVLWTLAFIVATFFWMVLFEHGFTMKGLTEGTGEELRSLSTWISGGKK